MKSINHKERYVVAKLKELFPSLVKKFEQLNGESLKAAVLDLHRYLSAFDNELTGKDLKPEKQGIIDTINDAERMFGDSNKTNTVRKYIKEFLKNENLNILEDITNEVKEKILIHIKQKSGFSIEMKDVHYHLLHMRKEVRKQAQQD